MAKLRESVLSCLISPNSSLSCQSNILEREDEEEEEEEEEEPERE